MAAAFRTQTATLVVQRSTTRKDHLDFAPQVAIALREYADDVTSGNAGASGYERHVTRNHCRIDVIFSIPPERGAHAREDISGDGDTALKERLLKLRHIAQWMPGGENDNAIARHAYRDAAKDLRELIDETLAAIGVPSEGGA